MKFDCNAPSARHKRMSNWHRWFAWRPVQVGENDCRWLEYVERKGAYWECVGHSGWDWNYRAL